MCGIIGGYSLDINIGLKALHHRGPDAAEIQSIEDLSLGHARLNILSTTEPVLQPVQVGPITLVFNGEIWNYDSIVPNLPNPENFAETKNDARLLAALFSSVGINALEDIDGMFAIAFHDARDDSLTLVRDRFGEIPLHILPEYPFVFASELKAFNALGLNDGRIMRLPPGHFAVIKGEDISFQQYYQIPDNPLNLSEDEASIRLRELIIESVETRLIGEARLCTLLSGGIDSAIITAILHEYKPDIEAFIAVYDPDSFDLAAARMLTSTLGINLHEVEIPFPTREDLAEIIRIIEMPHKAQVEIAWPCHHLVRRINDEGYRVVFSGDASDELWASYYFAQKKMREGKADWFGYRRQLLAVQENKNFSRANKIFMHKGVEVRLPFLHRPLVELALNLREEIVQGMNGSWKHILGLACKGLIPEEIINREKLAFQTGLGLRTALRDAYGDTRKLYQDSYRDFYKVPV